MSAIIEEDNHEEEVVIAAEEEGNELEGEYEERSEEEEGEEVSGEEYGDEEESETIVMIGDEEPDEQEKAPGWVRELRQRNRELMKENKELKRQTTSEPEAIVVGKKPSLDDPDIDYDTEKFEAALEDWHARKLEADAQARKVEEQKAEAERAWQARLEEYNNKKAQIGVTDYDDAEDTVRDTLDETQQGIIVHGADNAALVVYALGKNPSKAKELASISDPVKFAFAVARLESQLKVEKRKSKPETAPEKKLSGTAPKSGVVDNTLEKLRKEAERTGDYTKVTEYKRSKRK